MTAADIRSLRVRMGLSQQAMADRIGCRRGTLLGWEKGHTKPLPTFLRKLERLRQEG